MFEEGSWSFGPETFLAPGFLKELAARGLVGPADVARLEPLADGDARSLMRGLIEGGTVPAARAWELAGEFSRDRLYEVFDWTEGTYDLGPAPVPAEAAWVRGVSLSGLILEGIRRMGSLTVIEAGLPGPDEKLRSLAPRDEEPVALAPHERYVLSVAEGADRLGEVVRTSPLGERETKRALFALLVLGLLATRKGGPAFRRILPRRHGPPLRGLQRPVFLHLQVHIEGARPRGPQRLRKIAGRGPGSARPCLPGLRSEAGRADRAPHAPPEEPGRLERRRQKEPSPKLRRDPGRGGPGRQAEPWETGTNPPWSRGWNGWETSCEPETARRTASPRHGTRLRAFGENWTLRPG